MRNLIIAVLLIAAGLGAYFYLAGQDGTTETPPAAPAATTVETAAPEPAADPQPEKTAANSNAPAETVEESTGEVAAEEVAAEHNLRLAQADTSKPAPASSRFKKDVHYKELVPAQPTVTGTDKIEVVEVFWYGCGHCFAFDPSVKAWAEKAPADVDFVRMPAIWNRSLENHARAFYIAQSLTNAGKLKNPVAFHDAFFEEIHVNRQPLASERSIKAFFARFGISGADFDATAKSFEVDQKIRTAKDLTRRYGISSVPAIVVNGRYSSLSGNMKGYGDYLGLMDALSELER
ncbi:MAG: thiol:disulfide interchange protein DsbA/DsbL [Pseudomonadota bacterium]